MAFAGEAKYETHRTLAILLCCAKFSVSCLCAATVLSTFHDAYEKKDHIVLSLGFLSLVIADFFLVILYQFSLIQGNPNPNLQTAGIICFMVVQTFFIYRHSRNILQIFKGTRKQVAKNITFELIFLLCAAIPIIILYYVVTKKTGVIMLIYGVYIILSVYTAWTTFKRNFFDKQTCWLIAIGMTCFFCCDVNVGLSGFSEIVTPLIWMFYTPALLLLTYSGLKRNSDTNTKNT